MTSRQVRLDPEVADALQAAADRAERSLANEVNIWLRRALRLPTGPTMAPAPPRSASVSAPKPKCPHPVNMRMGGRCRVPGCGATVTRLG
jgi:hypothetical protein